jgi:AP-1 complex subunit mu
MASQILILDFTGKLILSRDYRGDIPTNAYKKFVKHVITDNDANVLEPVLQIGDYSYIYHKNDFLYCKSKQFNIFSCLCL